MCGICGQVRDDGDVVERALLERMCSRLVHRGPDDQGIHTGPAIGLGQRRLAIIDLNRRAVAPLSNEDGTIWVTFNGEIYNFEELRSELLARGHQFRTATDTEVLVHLYEEHGLTMLDRLRGMFAFAIWDGRARRLFAARDRLGKKPLYYTHTRDGLTFGSEIKALLAHPAVSAEPNYRAIDQYLSYQYVPSPLTAFMGIFKLPPAHFLTYEPGQLPKIERYWSPPEPDEQPCSDEDVQAELLDLLKEAIRLRMISDVPIGAFLSGGVDSGAVVALMAEQSSQPIKTFSIGFDEDSHNELPYARLVANRYGTDHHEFVVRPDAAEVLPLLVRHYDEPFADASALPTYYVSKLTRQHVAVALSGDGGDESFAGYTRYAQVHRWRRFDQVPQPLRQAGHSLTRAIHRVSGSNTSARLVRAGAMLAGAVPERYRLQMTTLKPQEKEACYSRQFQQLVSRFAPFDPLTDFPWQESMDDVAWMMRHDQHFYLPDCLMVKVDIASMANSIEMRSPLLDHKLVEFAARLPSRLKLGPDGGKQVFKRVVAPLLPAAILTKPKTGFGIPLAQWFRGELNDLLRGTLLDDCAQHRGLFQNSFVERMVDEQTSGKRDWSNRLWALMRLELWFREYID